MRKNLTLCPSLRRCRRGLQVRQVREGVCVQVLQGQAPQVHTLRGPGRQEVPVSPLQQVLREEGQAEDPHFARSRKTQASQGNGSAHSPVFCCMCIIPPCNALFLATLRHRARQYGNIFVRANVGVVLKEQLPAASLQFFY